MVNFNDFSPEEKKGFLEDFWNYITFRSATGGAPRRVGYSIHYGLDKLNPASYGGWEGVLPGCVLDAIRMHDLAKKLGYKDNVLLKNEQATRERLKTELKIVREKIKAKEQLFLTGSSHGSQVRDVNGDEADSLDEAIVLFDGLLLDDEIAEIFNSFPEGSEIIFVSDSCHSGTVIKEFPAMDDWNRNYISNKALSSNENNFNPSIFMNQNFLQVNFDTPKILPDKITRYISNVNGEQYKERTEYRKANPLEEPKCKILLFSGCADNQYSYAGEDGSLFTNKFLKVVNNGSFSGSNRELIKQIAHGMRSDQSPQLSMRGINVHELADAVALKL